MKKTIATLALLLCATIAAVAQQQTDFASKFLKQYEGTAQLNCQTIGPDMMEMLLSMKGTQLSDSQRQQLRKVKTMRLVQGPATYSATSYYDEAINLLTNSNGRFEELTEADGGKIYARRNDGTIVELVLAAEMKNHFILVDITGTIDEDAINQLLKNI